MTSSYPAVSVAQCLLIVSMLGCGGNARDQLPLVPVHGAVTLDGKPLGNTMVTFVPAGNTKGQGASGVSDAEGKYELAVSAKQKGTPVGEYRVVASKLIMPDGSDFPRNSSVAPIDSPARESLPPCYSNADKTILKATVPEGGTTVDFPLKSQGPTKGTKR